MLEKRSKASGLVLLALGTLGALGALGVPRAAPGCDEPKPARDASLRGEPGAALATASSTLRVSRNRCAMDPHAGAEVPFLVTLDRAVGPRQRLRVLAVSEWPLGKVRLVDHQGRVAVRQPFPTSGPPWAMLFELLAPDAPGAYAVRLVNTAGAEVACVEATVRQAGNLSPRAKPASGIWDITRDWDDRWERVFSAWVAYLFHPVADETNNNGWRPLHRVLRNPRRNLIHNRLGWQEDDSRSAARIQAWADCGDVPYQLRAYFSWKFGLPFRYRRCSRGDGLRGPRCPVARNNRTTAFDHYRHPVRRFNAFIREGLAWQVHSGTLRTLPEDEGSDFYPIALSRASIRPGTVYVDVGGHAFVVTQWDQDGLYAVDGHPDLSVTRRRFSRRFFRYFLGTRTGGFKAFRPLRLMGQRIVALPNRAVTRFFSLEQYAFRSRRAFYHRMHRLLANHSS